MPDRETRQPLVLVVDDEEHITEMVAMALRYERLRRRPGRHRAGGARPRGRPAARPAGPRRHAPRPRRLRGGPSAPPRRGGHGRRPRHLPDRPRHHRRQGRGAPAGQRRLRHQAVQHRGAGRAGEGGAAPHVGDGSRRPAPGLRRPGAGRGHPRRVAGGSAGRPDPDRVRPPALPAQQRPPGAHPRPDPRARLGHTTSSGNASVLETYISYLRHKIDDVDPPLIHTVRGVGYTLRLPREA